MKITKKQLVKLIKEESYPFQNFDQFKIITKSAKWKTSIDYLYNLNNEISNLLLNDNSELTEFYRDKSYMIKKIQESITEINLQSKKIINLLKKINK